MATAENSPIAIILRGPCDLESELHPVRGASVWTLDVLGDDVFGRKEHNCSLNWLLRKRRLLLFCSAEKAFFFFFSSSCSCSVKRRNAAPAFSQSSGSEFRVISEDPRETAGDRSLGQYMVKPGSRQLNSATQFVFKKSS